ALVSDLVGATMALDNDAIEAEENSAIDRPWVELGADGVKRLAGEQRADLAPERGFHRIAQIGADLPRRAFGGLERDIAGKALGHHHVDGALAQIVALDEPLVGEPGVGAFAQ